MKSVTFSEVVRLRDGSYFPKPVASARQLVWFGLTLALGLPAIIVAFHLLDPAAPLGYIVLPVLAGGVMPVFAALPGRLEVRTRFDARHLVGTLDETLAALGYAQAPGEQGAVRYRARANGRMHLNKKEISVTVGEHALEIVGPFDTLCALQKSMAC